MIRNRVIAALFAAGFIGAPAMAQELELEYTVEDIGGGQFQYEFTLGTDAGWAPGMGWRWFVFGDEPGNCGPGGTGVSPLTNWSGDPASFPVGPWTSFGQTSGCHNGVSLGPVLDYWFPSSTDETLTWRGTSTADLRQGEMLFSTLAGTEGGAVAADWKEATRIDDVCIADWNGDGEVDINDFFSYLSDFEAGDPRADLNSDGEIDINDFFIFLQEFEEGC